MQARRLVRVVEPGAIAVERRISSVSPIQVVHHTVVPQTRTIMVQPEQRIAVDKINQIGPHSHDLLMNYNPFRYQNVVLKQEPQIDTIPAPILVPTMHRTVSVANHFHSSG